LLAGASASGEGTSLGRFFGIALLALGLACWPGQQRAWSGSPIFRAMLTYNVLVALYLAYLGTFGPWRGWLLWPAVALHAVMALLLAWTWRTERQGNATNKRYDRSRASQTYSWNARLVE
jgi:hypothetical protein